MEFNATFLVSIISFLMFMYIMNAIFYKPLTAVINERETLVNGNSEASRKSREKAEKILKDKEFRLSETAKQSRQILIDKTNEANNDYKTTVDEAKLHAGQKTEFLKKELLASEQQAKTILDNQTEDLAQAIVNKVLQGGVNA